MDDVLTQIAARDSIEASDEDISSFGEEHHEQIRQFEELAGELGQPGPGLAAAPAGVTAPIVGPRALDQLTGALPAAGLNLDAATLELLDGLFPGPGGAAPEAYVW